MNGKPELEDFIRRAFQEDVGRGDHTSMACISDGAAGKASLLVKDQGVVAGVELAEQIFRFYDPAVVFRKHLDDGTQVKPGDIVFSVEGSARSVLTSERLVLNCMQRMSGIATMTSRFVEAVAGFPARVLDTRKTTPLCRTIEKWAVRIGGGMNHRYGLFDMILIKDNHVDYAGGIPQAIRAAKNYLEKNRLELAVEIETRNMEEVRLVLETGGVNRILLDNFSPAGLREAVLLIDRRYETEASGGITLDSIREYAATGVDFISAGALTHSFRSLDMSLKAVR